MHTYHVHPVGSRDREEAADDQCTAAACAGVRRVHRLRSPVELSSTKTSASRKEQSVLYGEGGGREHYCTAGLGSAVAVQHGSLPEEGRQRQPPRSVPPSSRARPSRAIPRSETCRGGDSTRNMEGRPAAVACPSVARERQERARSAPPPPPPPPPCSPTRS